METCLSPAELQYFLGMLDATVVQLSESSKDVTIQSGSGPVVWKWMEVFKVFCVDGIYFGGRGQMV